MTDRGLMQEALSVLEKSLGHTWSAQKKINELKDKLRKRLSQPEPEPVAYVDGGILVKSDISCRYTGHLYTAPSKSEWVGLTDDETTLVIHEWRHQEGKPYQLCKAIEAKLKEKNT